MESDKEDQQGTVPKSLRSKKIKNSHSGKERPATVEKAEAEPVEKLEAEQAEKVEQVKDVEKIKEAEKIE
jgi:hypothetical protein